VRGEIWDLYADLKAYRRHPDPAGAPALAARFNAIFTQRTSFATLNQTLKRLHAHKEKLLLVLKRPDIVPHTNGSEGDHVTVLVIGRRRRHRGANAPATPVPRHIQPHKGVLANDQFHPNRPDRRLGFDPRGLCDQ
jgi:hypothetical protein